MKDNQEFEMLLDEIPHATSRNLHHHLLQQKQRDPHHHHRHQNHHRGFLSVKGERFLDSGPSWTCHGGNDMHGDDQSSHYKHMCVSPVSDFSLKSDGSISRSHSDGFSFFDGGSPTSPLLDETKSHMPPRNTNYLGGFPFESQLPNYSLGNNTTGEMMDELSLSRNLDRLYIADYKEDSSVIGRSRVDSHGSQVIDCLGKTNYVNAEKNGPVKDCERNNSDYGGTQCLFPASSMSLDERKRSALLLRLQQESQAANLSGSCITLGQFQHVSDLGHYAAQTGLTEWQTNLQQRSDETSKLRLQTDASFHRNYDNVGVRVCESASFIARPPVSDAFNGSQRIGIDSNGGTVSDSLNPSLLSSSWLPQGVRSLHCYSLPVTNGSVGANPSVLFPRPVSSIRNIHGLEAFNCEDSLIIQERGSNYILKKKCDHAKQHFFNETGPCNLIEKSYELYGPSNSDSSQIPKSYCPFLLPLKYNSLSEVQGYIYYVAKDQHGCRFLQRKFDERNLQEVQMIFKEIIYHVVELMMNPFGNYLIQKLLDVCNEVQRMAILLMVTAETGQLVEISLNSYGTRAVQKLIETLKTRQQISLFVSALEPGFLKLIKDLNGNHVVQRCLQCLGNEDIKFIFNAAARYCVDIATHRHGCCVLQRCIARSTGEQRKNLVTEVSANGLLLAQDSFGNYVVQYILELKIPFVTEKLISQFRGNYIHLSVQKFSSNVVEKCLKVFGEEDQSEIIDELLSASPFEMLLQDPYANYVIQSALGVSKGPLHAALVEAIRPHSAALRTSPHCKKIFSRTLLRK